MNNTHVVAAINQLFAWADIILYN